MTGIPKVWIPRRRAEDNRIHIWLPYAEGNRRMLKSVLGKGCPLARESGYWKISRNHAHDILAYLVRRYGRVQLFQDYTETTKCDTRCREAFGEDCECSCLGENHANGQFLTAWEILVGETTIIGHKGKRVERFLSRRR